MENGNIKKEDLFNVIKYGHAWHSEKIKDELEKNLLRNSRVFNHSFRYENDDKYNYIYDNDCYLFVFDGKIEVRCDRENVFSENKTFTYQIGDANDISLAYERFKYILMEDDEN